MPSLDIIIPAYNAEHCLTRTLEAIFEQSIPTGLVLGVIVVNNRSTDGTGELIDQWADKGVRRIDYRDTQSRSSARNAGIAASKADYALMLDADCRLLGQDCVNLVAAAMADGVDAGFGYATGASDDFWGRYHRSLAVNRATAGWLGWTSQCLFVRCELLEAVGGFPIDYQYYGFEDRDFICRLRSYEGIGELRSLPDLQVLHDDDASAQDVCEKMYVSGRYSSGIFKRDFSKEYLATIYAFVDVDTAPGYMVFTLKILQPLRPMFIRIASYLAQGRNTPLAIGRPVIRLCSALSYFQGTVDRNRKQ
jgi:glycosyltransferase involved in cell wall biosynthesis